MRFECTAASWSVSGTRMTCSSPRRCREPCLHSTRWGRTSLPRAMSTWTSSASPTRTTARGSPRSRCRWASMRRDCRSESSSWDRHEARRSSSAWRRSSSRRGRGAAAAPDSTERFGVSRLRVGGGEARGRRLKAPKGIRPTQGMVKAAIFNIVGSGIEGAYVLDLFAGSGAIGIEALSRGAAEVTFVDKEPRGLAILRQNLDALELKERARVVRGEVGRAELVFLDPPYEDVVLDRVLLALDRTLTDAIVVAEHSRRQELPLLSRLQLDRQRRYGDTMVTVFRV